MRHDWKLLIAIFVTFLKIGPITFGGGYGMVPMLEKEVVGKKKWITPQEMTDLYAYATALPGAAAVNSATLVGYRLAGSIGAIIATIGVLLPTFVIVIIVSIFYTTIMANKNVLAALKGVSPAVVALIFYAAYKIKGTSVVNKASWLLAICTILILLLFNVHTLLIISSGALIGIVLVHLNNLRLKSRDD